jgi:vacuolar protein sorting-associated protein 54
MLMHHAIGIAHTDPWFFALVCQITATHLALASQSVGLLVTQVPVLRGVLASRLPSKHHVLLTSLDRVSRDCQEHQKEIFSKLVAIMAELVRGMVDKLDTLPWTKSDAAPGQTSASAMDEGDKVDECVKTLMKQTCSLHRALSDLLLVEQRDAIFQDISRLFLTSLVDFLNQLDTKKPYVKLKVSYNVNHIITRYE